MTIAAIISELNELGFEQTKPFIFEKDEISVFINILFWQIKKGDKKERIFPYDKRSVKDIIEAF